MEDQISNFQQTVMFIVIVLVAGWYWFDKDDWTKPK